MARLRETAIDVKRQGAIARRDWSPSKGSFHYRIYRWWERKSGKEVVRENFCHYCRVVLIWAPLRWLVKPMLYFLMTAFVVFVGVVLWLNRSDLPAVLLSLVLIAYCVIGVFAMAELLAQLFPDEINGLGLLDDRSDSVKGLVWLAVLPVLIVSSILLLVALLLLWTLISLHEDYDLYRKVGRWSVGGRFGKAAWISWLRPWYIPAAVFAGLSIRFGFFWYWAIPVGAVALILAVALGISWLVDRGRNRIRARNRAERERRALAERQRLLLLKFMVLHPARINAAGHYESWLQRYDDYCQRRYGYTVLEMPEWRLLDDVSIRLNRLFPANMTPNEAEPAKPSGLWSALVATGDFFVLIWSFVLTRKWKICPLVELPR